MKFLKAFLHIPDSALLLAKPDCKTTTQNTKAEN